MRLNALCVTQPSGRRVYAFGILADELLRIVQVPRIRRAENDNLFGFQRPEVSSHIAEIRRYLESADAILPNAVVIAFDDRVTFEEEAGYADKNVSTGWLRIPDVDETDPCGFVIDGQQRLAAVTSASVAAFPIIATGLIAPSVAEQRKQFVLVNRTKPLPQGLVYELLPEITGCLPQVLTRQQMSSSLCQLLNFDPKSALFQMIRTPTCPYGIIKDNSMRRALTNSLTDGALARISSSGDKETHVSDLADVVSVFWGALKLVFPEAVTLPPNRSRLTHGVGVVSSGFLMDQFYATRADEEWTVAYVINRLRPLAEHCAWTSGSWEFAPDLKKPWNDLQNTDRDIRYLVSYFKRVLAREEQPVLTGAD